MTVRIAPPYVRLRHCRFDTNWAYLVISCLCHRGTPYYMAPEAYRGRPAKESDQYALAVVVYEWPCGNVPFSEGDFIQLGYQHSHEPVPPLHQKNPAIPLKVEAIIMKALSMRP